MDFDRPLNALPRRAFLSTIGSVAGLGMLGSEAALSAPAPKPAEIKLGVCSYPSAR
jgi:hypothetical protein